MTSGIHASQDSPFQTSESIEANKPGALQSLISPAELGLPSEADAILGKDRNKIFDEIARSIREVDSPSSRGLGHINSNLGRELARTKERFLNARSKEDVYYALLSLRRSLHDMHSKIEVPEELKPPRRQVTLPLRFAPIDNHGVTEYKVVSSEVPSITVGMVLRKFAGQTPREMENRFSEWFGSTSPEFLKMVTAEWLSSRESWHLPTPAEHESVSLHLWDPSKKNEKEMSLRWQDTPEKPVESQACGGNDEAAKDYIDHVPVFIGLNYCLYSFPPGKSLVIRYFSFDYEYDGKRLKDRIPFLSFRPSQLATFPDLAKTLFKEDREQLASFLRSKPTEKLVIDVRENDGGGMDPELFAIFAKAPYRTTSRRMLFSKYAREHEDFFKEASRSGGKEIDPPLTSYFKGNPTADKSPLYPFFPRTPSSTMDEAIYAPLANIPKSSVMVLTGPKCQSACDQFAAIMKDNGIARIIGQPTMGASSPFRGTIPVKLMNGSTFKLMLTVGETLRPSGQPIEGHPVTPDTTIGFQEQVLERAIRISESNN